MAVPATSGWTAIGRPARVELLKRAADAKERAVRCPWSRRPCRASCDPGQNRFSGACRMFAMDEADATAICAAFDKGGEQAAAVELQQRFPALTIERARAIAGMIVGLWPGVQDAPDT